MTNNDIPKWLYNTESYTPKKDNASFINKSISSLIRVLSGFRRNNSTVKANEAYAPFRLFAMLTAIILTSVSRNFSFTILMITMVTVRIAFLNAERIRALLKLIFPSIIFSLLILLPSAFLGNPKTLLNVLGKIFVCISMAGIFNLTTSYNDITASLKRFHIPDIIIFTFDIAIKYIYILGDACVNMLLALKCRSIGKNQNKKEPVSGILGTLFLRAKNYADETSKAMECRGFNGEYLVKKEKHGITKYDIFTGLVLLIIASAFVYLEVII
ncbi:MAG: energy-coupling factor transporter transmembrane component T [Eubacterium sp.]